MAICLSIKVSTNLVLHDFYLSHTLFYFFYHLGIQWRQILGLILVNALSKLKCCTPPEIRKVINRCGDKKQGNKKYASRTISRLFWMELI